MNIKEFTALAAKDILRCLREEGEDQVTVRAAQVMKMNDQLLYGLTFHREDDPAPTFYLNEMFAAYTSGVDLEDLTRGLTEAYLYNRANGPTPTEVPDLEYSKIRGKTDIRLLGTDYNRQFLKTVPYREVGNGYALICEVHIGASDGGVFGAIVTNDMAKENHYDMDRLFDSALETAWKTNAASLRPASQMLDMTSGADLKDRQEPPDEQETCYVLTTNRQRYGATALFYPGTQAMIAHVLGEDYYAIPSSQHEFIILRGSRVSDAEVLRKMVIEANRIVVSPEDVLSDNLLYYSKSTGCLSQVLPEEVYADFAG